MNTQNKIQMTEAAREAANRYQREWKRRNPEKIRQYNADYWERKAANVPIEDRINEMRNMGFSLREIADKLGLSHMTVSRILKTN